jgi:hypothetical protein
MGMGRIIIVNGSRQEGGYWGNEVRGNSLSLNTHCAAAMELAVARKRNDATYLNLAGEGINLRGPIVLERWQPNRGFFTLHFEGADQHPRPMLGPQAERVRTLLRQGQHLVICDGKQVKPLNMETRQPPPAEVEEALRAASVTPI